MTQKYIELTALEAIERVAICLQRHKNFSAVSRIDNKFDVVVDD